MTQEDKQLLLIDLCGRLPYEVKCKYYDCCEGDYGEGTICGFERHKYIQIDGVCIPIEEVKPYLRPLSSITEDEIIELVHELTSGQGRAQDIDIEDKSCRICYEMPLEFYLPFNIEDVVNGFFGIEGFDSLNALHLDYRGLINKNLAIEVTEENNPYKD